MTLIGSRRLIRAACRQPDLAFLALRMTWWVVVVTALGRLCSMPRLFTLITPAGGSVFFCEKRLAPAQLAALLDMILRTNVAVLTPICWKRAAILYRYLRLAGHHPDVVFGVSKASVVTLTGHAWVELEGTPVCEPELPPYLTTYRFPG